jgi:hypothetical protein
MGLVLNHSMICMDEAHDDPKRDCKGRLRVMPNTMSSNLFNNI